MQLFLFSFYLNGLHSQAIVTATHTISSSSAGLVFNNEKQDELLPAPAPHIDGPIEHQYDSIKNLENHPGSSSTIQEYSSSQRSEAAASVDFLNSKSRAALGEAAKKAFNHMVANNKSTLDLVAMAAKKFSDPIDPMTKLGFNLLFNAINRKGQEERETPENDALNSNSVSNLSPSTDKSKDKTKLQYANLAQKSLQFLTNGIDSSSIKGGLDSGMLEMALQFMMQNSKLSKANFDPQTAKSVLSFLMNAMGNQKLEPKLLISLASKLMQSQQPTAGQHGGDMGLNLLSQMLSNGQLTSILLNGARAMQSVDSNDMSKSIYRNYLKQSSKKAPSFKSKNNLNRSVSKNKLGLDLNFRYSKEQNDYVCKKKGANSTIHLVMVISSADKKMERQVARETWISDFNNLSNRVKVVFFITSTNDISQDKSIREEAEEYHDIVQIYLDQSRQDEGHSLITTLAGFNWINKNCPGIKNLQHFTYNNIILLHFFCSFLGVKQILKIDDDIYVSSSKMLKIMENVNSGLSITGNIVSHLNPKTGTYLQFLKFYIPFWRMILMTFVILYIF